MTFDEASALADEYKALVAKRTGLTRDELDCPRARSYMTPCIARDGGLAVCEGRYRPEPYLCVGCEYGVKTLYDKEKAKHDQTGVS